MMRAQSRRANERTSADEAVGQTGERGGMGADGRANGAHKARTGGRAEEVRTGPSRRGRADGQTGRQAIGRTGGLGDRGLHCADGKSDGWAVEGGRAAVGWTRRTGELAVR